MIHKGLIFRALLLMMGVLRMFAQSGPAVWTAPSLHRVGMNEAPGSNAPAQLFAARNAYAAFQVVVNGGPSGASNVNLTLSDLQGPATISAANYNPYVEGYVYVDSSSPNWGGSNQPRGAGWYADSLIPFKDPATGATLSNQSGGGVPISIPAGQNREFWVDLLVPGSAPAGQYSGTFMVTSNQGISSGNVSLRVWNFMLPTTPSFKSTFLFWTAGNLASQEELIRHRLMPSATMPSTQPMLQGLGLNGADIGGWSGGDASTCSMSVPPSAASLAATAAAQASGLLLYDYTADEVDGCPGLYSTIQGWAQSLHAAGINNLITMSPTPALFDDGMGRGRSAVDIWAMLPKMYDNDAGPVQQALAKGDQIWSYNDLVQDGYSPKWEIDFDPVNFRIQPGFISQSLGLTGLLYWRVDWFTSDPWHNPNNEGQITVNNYPGEGMLVYPGDPVGLNQVVPSMRLKWLRDGVEDYEYLQILKQSNPALAMQIAKSVGPDWTNWSRDPNAIEGARQQAGNAIEQSGAGGGGASFSTGSAPAPAPSPSGPSGFAPGTGSPSPAPAPAPAPSPTCPPVSWGSAPCGGQD